MFDLELSQLRAEKRLRDKTPRARQARKPRSDRGSARIAPEALSLLRERLLGYERPHLRSLLDELGEYCAARGIRCPSRASVYQLVDRIDGHCYRASELPPAVRAALYNLGPDALVPGHQVAFYCFNYGELAAICFAAGMPWLDLHQAGRLRGWRAKSRGLWEAACRIRTG